MRSHRRRKPIGHVLIAGHADDLDDVRAALAILPSDAYGQVFIEAAAETNVHLAAPARVTIHRIDQSTGSLTEAIAAWAAEWVPDELDPQRRVTVWIGTHAGPHVHPDHHVLNWPVEHL